MTVKELTELLLLNMRAVELEAGETLHDRWINLCENTIPYDHALEAGMTEADALVAIDAIDAMFERGELS